MADKANRIPIARWIFLAALILFTLWYFKKGTIAAMGPNLKDPEGTLREYARVAENLSRGQVGREGRSASTLTELWDLVVPEDKEWFEKNYKSVFEGGFAQTGFGSDVGRNIAAVTPEGVKMEAIQVLLNTGVNRTDFKIVKTEKLSKTINYEVEVPVGPNSVKVVKVRLIKGKDRKWRVTGFAGGRRLV